MREQPGNSEPADEGKGGDADPHAVRADAPLGKSVAQGFMTGLKGRARRKYIVDQQDMQSFPGNKSATLCSQNT